MAGGTLGGDPDAHLARATGATFFDTDVIQKDDSYLGGGLAHSRGENIYTPE